MMIINIGWWFQPLWKILVNWDDYSKYMGKLKTFQTTNQNDNGNAIHDFQDMSESHTSHGKCIMSIRWSCDIYLIDASYVPDDLLQIDLNDFGETKGDSHDKMPMITNYNVGAPI